ncbi:MULTISPECIES: DUF4395 domain-containing protein [Planococcus]|uniref:DUF4395 domain-containing protein n=2 Tax=Planococcus TaxID=1372 RepID=A0ABN4JU37_9BACL|nr:MULTISPECIES: DUF4395 domain-containing protein [Planococcus]ALS77264.1 hypothetical protein AUO94_00770 [Planococcus kocurii]AQU80861.1 hypothetical protein AJGP001_16880 [Planococcus faecalis]KAA0956206.1 DUF4395 domain-containing protein [Planococcus sp. ANT_H30]MDJ0332219.1 DUF4395 domain-containing protein [Planococcus sp. S3-L1]OHX55839.1 hypothetical protein BB777_01455 [Planococcus faecalis]
MTIPKPLVQTNQTFVVVTVVAALLFHPAILLLPFVVGAYTLVTKKNPVIQLGHLFLKKPAASYQQEDKDQQLFNQWIATISLGLSLIFFSFGIPSLGFVFSIMVIIAAGVALMGYCIGCTIRFRYMMWKHNRTKVQV